MAQHMIPPLKAPICSSLSTTDHKREKQMG